MSERISARLTGLASLFLTLAVALAFIVASIPAAAQSQNGQSGLRTDAAGNSYAPELPSLGAATVSLAGTDKLCKTIKIDVKLSKPVGTGSEILDALNAVELRSELNRYLANPLDLESASECANFEKRDDAVEAQRTFTAYSPNPKILSVLYSVFVSSPWAAHPHTYFEALNYDLSAGRDLTISDILPPGEGPGLEALWAAAAKGWCEYNDYHVIPSYYGLEGDDLCKAPEKIPLPPALVADRDDLKGLGLVTLTNEGLVISLGANDGWSYADGPSELVIDKAAMIKLGARSEIWGPAK